MSEHILLYNNLEPALTTYVVAPCDVHKIERGDFVQIMRFRQTDRAVLANIRSSTPRDGRGTVLLHAAVTWALNNGLSSLMGRMMTTTPDLTREWYLHRGIEVNQSNIFNANLNDVWSICATIMANRSDSYRIENIL